ncbi:unnamed protein product [Thelazia callipaeda]|uniref:GST_C_6 domain-containing protein n=1 Tax=Thelazia callipaeda TaxID=103827 RepID=A0A0N5CV90_THECL|nr:unnamed protein product [Thelazia callipaeda]
MQRIRCFQSAEYSTKFISTARSSIIPTLFRSLNNNSKLHTKKWKKDVVYLYQFGRSNSAPNISPFCFKIETWLRANDLTHELKNSWDFLAWKKYLPAIELNGNRLVNSQMIIEELQKYFGLNDEFEEDDHIGIARAVDRMIECNTYYLLLYFILVENLSKFLKVLQPSPVNRWLIHSMGNKVHHMFSNMGIVHPTRNDIINMLVKDIKAIDIVLGDKKFLFGAKPTTPDFTVFGHLSASYYLPFHQPITDILDDEYPRVKRLIERMRQHYYPEWQFSS